jgi:hypothetical protein
VLFVCSEQWAIINSCESPVMAFWMSIVFWLRPQLKPESGPQASVGPHFLCADNWADGQEALALIRTGRFDLVLQHLLMPGLAIRIQKELRRLT